MVQERAAATEGGPMGSSQFKQRRDARALLTSASTQTTLSLAVRRAVIAATATAVSAAYPSLSLAQQTGTTETVETVVVTGSIIRRTGTETPSPVTVVSAASLEERGLNTVSEAVQRLTTNNAGTMQAGWNTGFNFASGATAPALRGLT